MKSEIKPLPKNQKIIVRLTAETDKEQAALMTTMLNIKDDTIVVWTQETKTLNILLPYAPSPQAS